MEAMGLFSALVNFKNTSAKYPIAFSSLAIFNGNQAALNLLAKTLQPISFQYLAWFIRKAHTVCEIEQEYLYTYQSVWAASYQSVYSKKWKRNQFHLPKPRVP
ncbi:hypothetical protein CROQUDRAFT_649839 [Cronartium quercuum f. sp. fusiforme G11]|uniref:Uncharacterized protein n=1 Tax=Cronartium quercuum f. sp. fusiforme G11 TaxID=708437 RepID=A0A9P6TJ49_9BASI|nr:hypothetical protein CROQUDRAFT_649839 [Cronartium quercuum f. sp. fusiforme G11]